MAKPRTLYDKIWDDHLVDEQPDGTCLIYIDRHLVHEVTSPQAFEGLRLSGRKVHAPDKTLLRGRPQRADHRPQRSPIPIRRAPQQIAYLAENAKHFGLEYFDEFDKRQGIVHIIGPEQGFTLPGTTHRVRRQPHRAPTARSARSPTASAPPRSSTCWRRRR